MTTAAPYAYGTPENSGRLSDRRWLVEYVELQNANDHRVHGALGEALDQADRALSRLDAKDGVGASARKTQLLASKSVLLEITRKLFLNVGDIVRADQAKAAQLSADLMFRDEMAIWRIIEPDTGRRERIQDSLRTTAARNAAAMTTRILDSSQPLSRRVYRSEALAKAQVHKVVNRNVALGNSAADLARDVRDLIRPDVPGGVSYRAKTLARTEINNAFHAQAINDMQNRPWIQQAQWNLSKSRGEENCRCDEYARTKIFHVGQIPKKPHPGCLCTVTPVLPDLDTALKSFMSGQYSPWLP